MTTSLAQRPRPGLRRPYPNDARMLWSLDADTDAGRPTGARLGVRSGQRDVQHRPARAHRPRDLQRQPRRSPRQAGALTVKGAAIQRALLRSHRRPPRAFAKLPRRRTSRR